MSTLQAFGLDSSLWNLQPSEDGISPADLLITSVEVGRATFSIAKYSATAISEGSFTVPVGAISAAEASGSFIKTDFYVNNALVQREIYSQGYDVSKIGDYQYELSLLSGDDIFEGSPLNNNDGDGIQGLAGNDRFKGYDDYEYGDSFYGGDGRDTSIYRGKISDYTIRFDDQIWDSRIGDGTRVLGFIVEDSALNRDGTDYLVEVERLEFEESEVGGANRVALDIGPSQNAGSVYMLYKAAFNRAPDEGGMGYWLAQKDGGANIVTDIAQGFVNSGEFTAKYGANPTNASYVDKLYLNVLGRAGEAGGVAYWNQELNAGNISKAAVLVQFATLAEGASIVAPLIANGIPYTEWVG